MNTTLKTAETLGTSGVSGAIALRTLNTKVINDPETRFGSYIDSVIMGQPEGRAAARRAYRRTLSKIRTGHQPYYVILAPGPTTCGKSELAYRLGEFLHGTRLAVLKIDGSEYMEKHNLSKLTGASPNLVGYTNRQEKDYVWPKSNEKDSYAELSQHNLTYARRGSKNPVTVILVDEWEKACLEFNTILLSIFRDGFYTLGNGEVVDFSNCIFVLTANIGSAAVEEAENKKHIGFIQSHKGVTVEAADEIITDHLRRFAPPEFRARVEENGEICIFHKLSEEQVAQICELKVRELCSVVEKNAKITVHVDEAARKWLLKKSGTVARMNGAVKSEITDLLDNEMIKGTIVAGNVVRVTHVEDAAELEISVEVLPLITEVTPEMLASVMAEADAEFAAIRKNAGKPVSEVVDEAAVRKVVEGQKAAADSTTSGADEAAASDVSLKSLQPFKVQFRCSTRELLAQTRAAVYEALGKAPHTDAVRGEMTYVEPFVATFDVYSTLDSMVALKVQFPKVHFVIVGGEVA